MMPPLLCQRNPATTQSAVRSCLIFIMARSFSRYGWSTGLATTPSSPAPSKRANQSAATSRSSVSGVRWIGGVASASAASSRARRSAKGSGRRSSSPRASRSKPDERRRRLLGQHPHP